MLRAHGWDVVTLDEVGLPERPEDEEALELAETFEENALAKARYFHALSGLPTMTDDSGLNCDALGGAPGVRSKRWSASAERSGATLDAANNAMLLSALAGAALSAEVRRVVATRAARFVCAAAFVNAAREVVARGETKGWILEREVGTGGFGYDPLFMVAPMFVLTSAELAPEEKNRLSHRGAAATVMLEQLRQIIAR